MTQVRVVYQTNRIDLFTKAHMGGDSDDIRRRFIQWNSDWFRHSPTFWLPPGRLFWVTEPVPPLRSVLAFGSRPIAFPDHGHRVFVALPPDIAE